MGFYTALLEENDFLDTTDFDPSFIGDSNDKSIASINDIASELVDAVNDNYDDQSKQLALDGQEAGMDVNPVEEMTIAIYESNCNWNTIMQALGTKELSEAYHGRDMVMESVDIKGFFNKIKDFFVKLFKKITAVIKQWINNATAVFRTNKSFVTKYGKDISRGLDAYYNDSKKKPLRGYPSLANGKIRLDRVVPSIKDDLKASKDLATKLRDAMSKVSKDDKKDFFKDVPELQKEHLDAAADAFRASFVGKADRISASEFRDKLNEYYLGEKKELSRSEINVKYIIDCLNTANDDIKAVHKMHSALKDSFNATISAINSLEKAVMNFEKAPDISTGSTNALAAVTQWSGLMKECKNASNIAVSVILKSIRIKQAQARRFGNAAIFALNKGKRKESFDRADGVKESAFFNFNLV